MSAENEYTTSCASCGIAEIDNIRLKECDYCDLVRYCSDECQRDHKSQHEEVCKKRAAELREELLFKQPEGTHIGDCPICMIPLSIEPEKSTILSCCGKVICHGCDISIAGKNSSCPFCRHPTPTREESEKHKIQRIEANDPNALAYLGAVEYTKGNFSTAFEYLTKAAGLGDMEAHYRLAILYCCGQGVGRIRKRKCDILKRLLLEVTPEQDMSLDATSGKVA
eukprot:scaffold9978_cov117-Skeletonema_menzelii.AAC.6